MGDYTNLSLLKLGDLVDTKISEDIGDLKNKISKLYLRHICKTLYQISIRL